MTTGIYELKFSNGQVYIGQSLDIKNRWEQHKQNMLAGKAATAMQRAYSASGLPEGRVLFECHRDYLDMIESIHINIAKDKYGKHNCLNTSVPCSVTSTDCGIVERHKDELTVSALTTISELSKTKNDLRIAKNTLKLLESKGIITPDTLKQNISFLEEENERLVEDNAKLRILANKTWWQRLFNSSDPKLLNL